MIIGVTGTRTTPTDEQKGAFEALMRRLRPTVAHHGDCWGWDHWVHTWCRTGDRAKVVVHPPLSDSLRAFCGSPPDDGVTVLPARTYSNRNVDIVAACEVLIAAPNRYEADALHSGTWMTIRMARRASRHHFVIYPVGHLVEIIPAGKPSVTGVRE